MNLRWLLRMRRWVDHPPSKQRMILIVAVIAVALAIVGLEHWGYWPDWATVEPAGRRGRALR